MPVEDISKESIETNESQKEEKYNSEQSYPKVPENQEKKSYINLYFCNISVGIIFTYVFVLCSITTNIIDRAIFYKFEFEFEVFLLLIQEIFNMLFYIIASNKSKIFKSLSGEISFTDFYILKFQYIGYTLFSILQALISLLGYQLVKNIPMYVNLRKLVSVMIFTYQFFFKKKKMTKVNIVVVAFLTAGAILAGIDDYDTDYIGYLVIFCKNSLNVINLEISENFKKKNGVSNVKLLAYKSFISPPLLLIILFSYGEHREIMKYFKSEHKYSYFQLLICLTVNLFIILINNLSFFISNEKNNSLFTQLLSDSKYIFITLLSYFILKTFSFTWKNILGLILSTFGAIIITISSMYENIEFKKNKIKKDKKRFVELSNIEEIDSSIDDKITKINENSSKNDDIKVEKDDTDSNNVSVKSTEIEDNENNDNNNDSINFSNDNISNNSIQNSRDKVIISVLKNDNDINDSKEESKNDLNNKSNNDNSNDNNSKDNELEK